MADAQPVSVINDKAGRKTGLFVFLLLALVATLFPPVEFYTTDKDWPNPLLKGEALWVQTSNGPERAPIVISTYSFLFTDRQRTTLAAWTEDEEIPYPDEFSTVVNLHRRIVLPQLGLGYILAAIVAALVTPLLRPRLTRRRLK